MGKEAMSTKSKLRRASTYNRSVFVNCSRDARYGPLRRAIAFALYECKFIPRSMIEDDFGVGYERVLRLIRSCRYGIHDLSAFGRNTPFDLGLFLGASNFGEANDRN